MSNVVQLRHEPEKSSRVSVWRDGREIFGLWINPLPDDCMCLSPPAGEERDAVVNALRSALAFFIGPDKFPNDFLATVSVEKPLR